MELSLALTYSCVSTIEQYLESSTQKITFHGASLHNTMVEASNLSMDMHSLMKHYLHLLTHASDCQLSNCAVAKCNKMKKLRDHFNECDFKSHCQYFRSFYYLTVTHSNNCRDLLNCRVSGCKEFKMNKQLRYVSEMIDTNVFLLNFPTTNCKHEHQPSLHHHDHIHDETTTTTTTINMNNSNNNNNNESMNKPEVNNNSSNSSNPLMNAPSKNSATDEPPQQAVNNSLKRRIGDDDDHEIVAVESGGSGDDDENSNGSGGLMIATTTNESKRLRAADAVTTPVAASSTTTTTGSSSSSGSGGSGTDEHLLNVVDERKRREILNKRTNLVRKLNKWHEEFQKRVTAAAGAEDINATTSRTTINSLENTLYPVVRTHALKKLFEKLNLNNKSLLSNLNFARFAVRIIRKEMKLARNVSTINDYVNLLSGYIYRLQVAIKSAAASPVTELASTTTTATTSNTQQQQQVNEQPPPTSATKLLLASNESSSSAASV